MDRKVMFVFAVIAIAAAGLMLMADDSDAAAEGEVGYQFTVGDLTYEVTKAASGADPAEVEVHDCLDSCIKADIPAEVNGYKVTSIGDYAFYGCTSLTSVTIPSSVTSIGISAFDGCTSLTSVTIPSSVTSIGDHAFYDCDSLTSVTIPYGVISIGYDAFSRCSSLTSVVISSSVTSIRDYAFSECTSLISITVDEANNNYSSDEYGVLFNKGKTQLIQCPGGFKGGYTIPSSVTSIGESAFYDCDSLTSVTIPSSVTSIGESAFFWCTSLISVTIPSSVTSIGESAFHDCDSLTSVTIPYGVISIGYDAFSGCNSLTSVTISSSVTSIGDCAFERCTSLISITVDEANNNYSSDEYGVLFNKDKTELIQCPGGFSGEYSVPSSVTSIGGFAFSECTSLISVTIPSSVISIRGSAFNYCNSLVSIDVEPENTKYSSDAFGVLFNKDKTELIHFPEGIKGEYTIPFGITSIGNHAFGGCNSLTSVTIPSSVTSIGNHAFYDCSLPRLIIPSSVTSIDKMAFRFAFLSHDGSSIVETVQGKGYVIKGINYCVDSLETTIISEGKSSIEFVKYGTLLKDLDLKKEGFVLDKFYSDAEHTESIPSDSAVTKSGMTLYCTWKVAESPSDDGSDIMPFVVPIAAAVVILALLAVILIKRRG